MSASIDPLVVIRKLRHELDEATIKRITSEAALETLQTQLTRGVQAVKQAVSGDHEPSSDDVETLLNWVREVEQT